jgi:hypothetical protein
MSVSPEAEKAFDTSNKMSMTGCNASVGKPEINKMVQFKIKGWDHLSWYVRHEVETHIESSGLPWEINGDGYIEFNDILIRDDSGISEWSEHVRAYLGALIYLLLWAELSGQTGLGAVALSMSLPPGTPTTNLSPSI